MPDTRIILFALWIALMLTYLLGDVLRIYAGDITPGEIAGTRITQTMMLGIAVLMLVPIVLLVLTLIAPYPVIRWVNIIAAVGLFLFNLVGLPTYPGTYDKFLIAIGLLWNVMTVIYAWNWAG